MQADKNNKGYETYQLLKNIFLVKRNTKNNEHLVNNLTKLLNLPSGIEFDFSQAYTPFNDGQDIYPQGFEKQIYEPELRWDWDGEGQVESEDNPDLAGLNGEFLRFRFFWAIQTMTRIIVKDIYEKASENTFVNHSRNYKTYKQTNPQTSIYQAIGLVHQFVCLHRTSVFIPWHIPFGKLFENWIKLADHVNLYFSDEQLSSFKNYKNSKPVYFSATNPPTSSIDDLTKSKIRKLFQENPSALKQLSTPVWIQQRLTSNPRRTQVNVPGQFYTKYTKYINRAIYFKQGVFELESNYNAGEVNSLFNSFYTNPNIVFNTLLPPSLTPSPQINTNLEQIHDRIHGGLKEPMEITITAAFDAIFSLHHGNMDRLRQIKIRQYYNGANQSNIGKLRESFKTDFNSWKYGIENSYQYLKGINYGKILNTEFPLFPFARYIDRDSQNAFNKTFYRGEVIMSQKVEYTASVMVFQTGKPILPKASFLGVPGTGKQLHSEEQVIKSELHSEQIKVRLENQTILTEIKKPEEEIGQIKPVYFRLLVDSAKLETSYAVFIYALRNQAEDEFFKEVDEHQEQLETDTNKFRHHTENWNIIHIQRIFTGGINCSACKKSSTSTVCSKAFNVHNIPVDQKTQLMYVYVRREDGKVYRSAKAPNGLFIERIEIQQ